MVLLDLTAAFDTVDHIVLLERLEHSVGIKGIALQWFASYVSRAFVVDPDGLFSHVSPLMQNSFSPKDCEKELF